MPIITSTGITHNGFVLPDYYSWDAILINGRKEGRVTVKDGYGIVSHILQFVNDQLNGVCEFYNNGELAEKRTYKNNIEEGWSCELEQGREVRWFMYSNGVKKGELKKCNNMDCFWELYDIGSGSLLSICKYDENHKCIGKGYLYENNHINRVVKYTSPGVEGLVLKSFNGDEMIEYDIHGNEVYKGGYKNDITKDYPREGKGRVFANEVLIYEGEFHHNIREGTGCSYREGKLEYSGEWKNNLPDGNGWITVKDKVHNGRWVEGRYNVEGNKWYNYSTGTYEEVSGGSRFGAGLAATLATGVTGILTHAGGAVATVIGFSSPGAVAGSTAASLMSASATSGIGAGAISAMQSAGALFANAVGGSAVAAAGAIAAPLAVGAVAYVGYRHFFSGSTTQEEHPEETANEPNREEEQHEETNNEPNREEEP